jgi:hypothetical protein
MDRKLRGHAYAWHPRDLKICVEQRVLGVDKSRLNSLLLLAQDKEVTPQDVSC